MSSKRRARYVLDPGPDVDLEAEEIRDSKGARIDQEYVERAVEDVHRAMGRPSLTAPGQHSPAIAVRLPAALRAAVRARAEREGKSVSEIMREAVQSYIEG